MYAAADRCGVIAGHQLVFWMLPRRLKISTGDGVSDGGMRAATEANIVVRQRRTFTGWASVQRWMRRPRSTRRRRANRATWNADNLGT